MRSYFKLAFKVLGRRKFFTFISFFGITLTLVVLVVATAILDNMFAPRKPESSITQKEMDLARSIQAITEEVMLKMTKYAYKETGMKKLCMAGGVALNCVANGRILREVPFEEIWIQPAAGDAGGALGIALAIWHRYLAKPRLSPEAAGTWRSARAENKGRKSNIESNGDYQAAKKDLTAYADGMKGSYLGPQYSEAEIEKSLQSRQLPYEKYSRVELPAKVAELLAAGKIIGLHQGRMEFGPRALGGRSIIGDRAVLRGDVDRREHRCRRPVCHELAA